MTSNKQLSVLILTLIFFATLMYVEYIINKNEYLKDKVSHLSSEYQTTLATQKRVSDLLVQQMLSDPKVAEILHNALSDSQNSKIYRDELYTLLSPYYEYILKKGFTVFHFHDIQGKSFLRFHRPKAYGDSLVKKRPSIKKISTEQKELFGFETGLYYEVFRSIYPIFYNETYVGSVELSVEPNSIINIMSKKLNAEYTILSAKSSIEAVLLQKDLKEQYTESWIDEYYINKKIRNNDFSDLDLEELSRELSYKLPMQKPLATETLNIFSPSFIYTFVPLFSIDGDFSGYIISQKQDEHIRDLASMQFIKFIFLTIFILSGIYFYRKTQKSHDESEKILEQYKYVMDQFGIVSKAKKDGTITYVNQKFCEVSGYNADELIGNFHNVVRHPDMKTPFFKQMWKQLLSKKIWSGVIKNRTKNGKDYFVQSTIAPILDEKNEILEFIALRQDVTEIISNKQNLEKEKNRLVVLFNSLDDIIVVKKENEITQINQQFFELFAFKDIYDFKQQHRSIFELFLAEDGYLHKRDGSGESNWLEKLIKDPQKENKVLIKDKNNQTRVFKVKVKKVPYETSYSYLIILSHLSFFKATPQTPKEQEKPTQTQEHHQEHQGASENSTDYASMLKQAEKSLSLPMAIINKLLDKFIQSTQNSLLELSTAIDTQDAKSIERIAHNIKGSASTLHLKEIAEYAAEIETSIKNGDNSDYKLKAQKLIETFQGLVAFRRENEN